MSTTPTIISPEFSPFARAIYLLCDIDDIQIIKTQQHNSEDVEFFSDKLKSLNPWGKMPLLQHNDTLIGESVAIARYLNELTPNKEHNLFGNNLTERAEIDFWLHTISIYADQRIIRNVVLEFAFPKGENGSIRIDEVKTHTDDLHECLTILNHQINHHFVIADRLTICDVFLLPMLDYLAKIPAEYGSFQRYSTLEDYFKYHQSQTYFTNIFS